MIKVEVDSLSITQRSGTTIKGKPWTMREQKAYAHVLDPDTGKPAKYPVKFKVLLGDDQDPYTPGMYQLDPVSIQVGDYEALECQRVKLVPLPGSSK